MRSSAAGSGVVVERLVAARLAGTAAHRSLFQAAGLRVLVPTGCQFSFAIALFRSAKQAANSFIIRGDMMNRGDAREAGIGGDQCIGAGRMGGCRQNGVKRAVPSALLVQPKPFAQIGFFDDEKWCQQLDVVACQSGSVLSVTPTSTDVCEFLDDLNCRGSQNRSIRYGSDQTLARLAKWMVCTDRIDQDCRVDNDHA